MEDILYTYHGQLYVNLTNQCPCACTFCIRSQTRAIGSAQDLWLQHDPSVEEVKAELDRYDLSQFQEVVFCGYGEPICALDRLIAVADYIHSQADISIRVNTNGLGDLIHGKKVAPLLKGHVDVVSIQPERAQRRGVQRGDKTEIWNQILRCDAAVCKGLQAGGDRHPPDGGGCDRQGGCGAVAEAG